MNAPYVEPIPEPTEVFTEDVKKEMSFYMELAGKERWQNIQTRLDLRDACPIGKDTWRYEGDMLDYFFPIITPKEEILKKIYERKQNELLPN